MKNKYQKILKDANLRITPQRLQVLETIFSMHGHPSADDITGKVKQHHPSIAVGTIYNILDNFVNVGILKRVKTEKGAMLYDSISDNHHHLYCVDNEKIEDYFNTELDTLLKEYFKKNKISGFKIEDIKLQLVGHFLEK